MKWNKQSETVCITMMLMMMMTMMMEYSEEVAFLAKKGGQGKRKLAFRSQLGLTCTCTSYNKSLALPLDLLLILFIKDISAGHSFMYM